MSHKKTMTDFKTTLYQLLGVKLAQIRNEKGFSQEHIAKKIGISRASVSNIEKGKHQIQLSTLYELSFLLETEIHMILPTYREVKEQMQNDDNPDLKSLLEKEILGTKTKSEIEKLIKNLK